MNPLDVTSNDPDLTSSSVAESESAAGVSAQPATAPQQPAGGELVSPPSETSIDTPRPCLYLHSREDVISAVLISPPQTFNNYLLD